MKLCFSTLGCCDRSIDAIVSLADGYNISAIEIRGVSGVMNNADIEIFSQKSISSTAALFERKRIAPIVLGTSCSFHNADKYDSAIAEGESSVKIAESLHIPYIRVFGNRYIPSDKDCMARIISGLRHLCALSESVTVLLEIHGDFTTVETVSPIIEGMASIKNFGLLWDIEHTHKVYGNDWDIFYTHFRQYIKHVHIKDYSDASKELTLIGKGSIPIAPIAQRMLLDEYDGYFSLEWEKKWHPELPDIEEALAGFTAHMNEKIF